MPQYGSGAQEEEAEKIEESNNEFDSEKLNEQPGASEDMVEEKDDDKDVEPIEEQKI